MTNKAPTIGVPQNATFEEGGIEARYTISRMITKIPNVRGIAAPIMNPFVRFDIATLG